MLLLVVGGLGSG